MNRLEWSRVNAPVTSMCLALCGALAGSPVLAQRAAPHAIPSSARALAPGVSYWHATDVRGPWSMHVVRVDLRRADIDVRAARAGDQLRGRERTSGMARRASVAGDQVLAAVNADFFDLKTGENENNQVVNGEWWKGLKVTESPFDTYDNIHVQFAMDAMRRPAIDRFLFDGKAWVRGVMTPIITLNANPSGAPEGTALYTTRFGASTPRDTLRQTAEASLMHAGRRGDTLLYVRQGAVTASSGSSIPANGAVLAAYGARTKEVQAMSDGDTVRVWLGTVPRTSRDAAPTMLIGGWPRILQNGVNVAGNAATIEGTISRNAEVRHPRTAIGYSRDGRTLWLFTVDGRSTTSVGMTLVEMADELKRLGAWQAMNFDGGGSTAMVIDGAVVNAPSDPTGEREVGNALLVVKRARPLAPGMPRSVRLLLNSGFTGANAWLLLAEARGYFKEEGIAVEFTPGRGAFTAAARIGPEGFDFGFGDINAVIEEVAQHRETAPVGIFMLFNRSPSAIILPAGSSITTPQQLEGRTIIGHATDVARNTFAGYAARAGVDPARVNIVADSSGWPVLLAAMEQGKADAVFGYLTTSTAAVEQMQRDVATTLRFLPFRDVVPDLYGSTLMASRRIVSQSPDVVRAFLRAANRGLVDAVADPDAALKSLAARAPDASMAVERNRMLGTFRGDMGGTEGRRIGIGDVDTVRLARAIALVIQSRGLARRPSHREVFSREFLPPLKARVTTLGAGAPPRD